MEFDILRQKLKAHQPQLIEHYFMKSIELFGSSIRGEKGEKNDIDILVDFYKTVDQP